jgi:hypothetical protein
MRPFIRSEMDSKGGFATTLDKGALQVWCGFSFGTMSFDEITYPSPHPHTQFWCGCIFGTLMRLFIHSEVGSTGGLPTNFYNGVS